MKKHILISLAGLCLPLNSVAADPTHDPHNVWGLWVTAEKTAKIDITTCQNNAPCGHIVWVTYAGNENPFDINNPDPDRAKQPLTGLKMIYGFRRKSTGWASGKIYNPEDGKTYKSAIKRKENGTLSVKGCVGPFCQTQIWTRPPT